MALKLAIVYGSRTCEHDVSIISAMQAAQNVNKSEYEIVYVYIDRSGDWYTGWRLEDINLYRGGFDKSAATRVIPMGENGRLVLMQHPADKLLPFGHLRRVAEADVVLTVLHGMNGEDGSIQGMLEMWNVPYTSSGIMGSALGMDKIAMKRMFASYGLPVVDDVTTDRGEWAENRDAVIARAEEKLSYPMYVKPANLGSSIGISRAEDRNALIKAIDVAVEYDRRVLIERSITDLMEINCAVLGYGAEAEASVTEMPVSWTDFLSFDQKYLRGAGSSKGGKLGGSKNSGGMASLSRNMPAPISDEMTKLVEEYAIRAFRALDCKGVARIDFMLDKADNKLYMGEINTIPGSLSYYLWEAKGLKFSQLIDKLVEYAFKAHADKNRNVFSYTSSILTVGGGAKGAKGKLGVK